MAILEVEVSELQCGEVAVLLECQEETLVQLGGEAVPVRHSIELSHPGIIRFNLSKRKTCS